MIFFMAGSIERADARCCQEVRAPWPVGPVASADGRTGLRTRLRLPRWRLRRSTSGRGVVPPALVELLLRLTERPRELGQLLAAEQDQDDHEDDGELAGAQIHGGSMDLNR